MSTTESGMAGQGILQEITGDCTKRITCKLMTAWPGCSAHSVKVMALLNHHKGWLWCTNMSTNFSRPCAVIRRASNLKSGRSPAAAVSVLSMLALMVELLPCVYDTTPPVWQEGQRVSNHAPLSVSEGAALQP